MSISNQISQWIYKKKEIVLSKKRTGEPRPSRSNLFSSFWTFSGRVSNAAFRSVSRSNSNTSTSGTASNAATPSREETTASNTTTATTQTPTTAGAQMGAANAAASTGSGAAFTIPTATTSHQGLRPSAVITDAFDPFLSCDSMFSTGGRRQVEHQTGRLRFTIPMRSSSVPAEMRRRPMDNDGPTATNTPPNTAALLEAFVQSIFPGLGMFNSMPVASFVNLEVGRSDGDFVNDLFALVTSTIRTDGVMEVLQQNYRSLNGLRVPLRDFLNRRLLNGEPYSPQLLASRLDRIVDSISRDIGHEIREADVDPSIDLVATVTALLKTRLLEIFKFVFEATETDNFGDRLAGLNVDLIEDVFSLLTMCCRDGSASVERVLLARAAELERQHMEMPMLAALMWPGIRRGNFRPNEALRCYIVKRSTTSESSTASAPATGAAVDDTRMDVDAQNITARTETTSVAADNSEVSGRFLFFNNNNLIL